MAQLSPNVGSGGAIGIGAFMNEQPLVRGISNVVGSLGGLTSALTLAGAATAALITQDAIQEVTRYEEELADLEKLLGSDMAEPLGESISELSTEMPLARKELMGIAEQAARFGIRGRDKILEFTKVIGEASVATDATAESASEALVKIAAVTQEPISNVRDLANVLNELSNTTATSFSELIQASGQLAPVLSGLDVNTEDIFALAAATNEVNISVRRGARRLRSFFQGLRETRRLEQIAPILGKTSDELERMVDQDEALELLVLVSRTMQEGGKRARELSTAFNRAASQGVITFSQNLEGFIEGLGTARDELEGGTSLADEYGIRTATAASKQQLLTNNINEAQRELGQKLLPRYKDTLELLVRLADALDGLPDDFVPLEELLPQRALDEFDRKIREAVIENQAFMEEELRLQKTGDFWGNFGFDEVGEAFAERLNESISRKMVMMPEGMRLTFFDLAMQEIERLGDISEGGAGSLEELQSRITKIARSLLRNSKAFDEASDAGDRFFKEIQAGDETIGVFSEGVADLISKLTDQRDSLKFSEFELVRQSEAYQNASEDAREFIDSLIAEIQQLQRMEDRLENMNEDLTFFESVLLGFKNPMDDIIQTQAEWMTSGADLIEQQEEELIRLREGRLALELYRIEQENLPPVWEEIAKERARQIHQLEQEEDAATDAERAYDRLQDRIADLTFQTQRSQLNLLEDSVQELSRSFMDFIEAAVTGSESLEDALVRMFTSIAETITEQLLQGMLLDFFVNVVGLIGPGATTSSGINKVGEVGHTFPGAARGGFFTAGQGVIVGEQGPELFVPRVAGTVVPNDQVGGGKTVNINVHNSFDVNAVDGKSVKRMLDENMEHIASGTTRVISQHQVLRRELLS